MKTISDLSNELNIVETVFKGVEGLDFISALNPEKMESILLMKYRTRVLTNPQCGEDDLKALGYLLTQKWKNLQSLLEREWALENGIIKTVNVSNDENEEREYSANDVNKTATYDSEDLAVEGGRESSNKENRKLGNEREAIEKTESIGNIIKNLQFVGKVNIIDIILDDIADGLCLLIY